MYPDPDNQPAQTEPGGGVTAGGPPAPTAPAPTSPQEPEEPEESTSNGSSD